MNEIIVHTELTRQLNLMKRLVATLSKLKVSRMTCGVNKENCKQSK